jgi:hypothetical protein
MNCPQCKQRIDDSSSFCDSCGADLTDRQDRNLATGRASASETAVGPVVTGPPGMGPAMAAPGPVPQTRLPEEPLGRWPSEQPATGPATTAQGPANRLPGPAVVGTPPALPGCPIRLSQQERVLRQYAAVQLRSRSKGEGMLYVTDSRVIFYATAKGRGTQRGSMLMQQTNVADITGVAAYTSRRISLGLIFLSGLFALFTVSTLFVAPVFALLWLIATVICVVALVGGAARRGSTGVMIFSRDSGRSPINFGTFNAQRGWIGSMAQTLGGPFLSVFGVFTVFDVLQGHPGQDTYQIITELGALILDLQTRGDLAYEYYGIGPAQAQPSRA